MWLAAIALGVSGFASLTLQVVWTRLLVQILGPTTYAFSTVVSIFIIGLAGGAAIGSRLASRMNPAIGLACSLLISAGLALAAASAVDWALLTIAQIVSRPEYQFADVLQREVLLVSGLLLPMTLAFGAAFPFAVAWRRDAKSRSLDDIGVIYAVNTIGAILGSLLSGFCPRARRWACTAPSAWSPDSARSWPSRFSSRPVTPGRAPSLAEAAARLALPWPVR